MKLKISNDRSQKTLIDPSSIWVSSLIETINLSNGAMIKLDIDIKYKLKLNNKIFNENVINDKLMFKTSKSKKLITREIIKIDNKQSRASKIFILSFVAPISKMIKKQPWIANYALPKLLIGVACMMIKVIVSKGPIPRLKFCKMLILIASNITPDTARMILLIGNDFILPFVIHLIITFLCKSLTTNSI